MLNPADALYMYFADCSETATDTIGMEIETTFLNTNSTAISVATSQAIFRSLIKIGWSIAEHKGDLITKLQNAKGDALLYELGRQNIELATAPHQESTLIAHARETLTEVYSCAKLHGAKPFFEPIFNTAEDLLVIPDERDAIWLELDGREALQPLATITAVQFTFSTTPSKAVEALNCLGQQTERFLFDYPQDAVWREYIRSSKANYRTDRYGGPLFFTNLRDYCNKLLMHDAVNGTRLASLAEMESFSIPLFLRSVWWYYRLRRYSNQLCIEVRPLPRRSDEVLSQQLEMVKRAIS